jgi:pimeloyl-ACP methyl ester carboxylesterase
LREVFLRHIETTRKALLEAQTMTESAPTLAPAAAERLFRVASELGDKLSERLHGLLESRFARVPLPPALAAERKTMRTHRGAVLSYYEDRHQHGHGRPLVLIHSINACASAAEVRPLFEHYRKTRPVYAVDLPGFGFGERGKLDYRPETYASELVDLLARVKDRDGDAPDVVALSLSCELVARAALARKDLVHLLAFISPTGLDRATHHTSRMVEAVLSPSRFWSPLVFQALVSKPSIRYFLGKSFVGPSDPELRDYDYATAHQAGAEYAPLAFLSGKLFTDGIFDTYSKLERPVLAIYDTDGYIGFDRMDELLGSSPLWSKKQIAPTRGMPHFEKPEATTTALDEFWASHAQKHL